MKAKLSTIVTELRGRAATVVAKQSQDGQIILMRSVGHDPKTNPQIRARMGLINLAHHWGNLTQAQRNDWKVAAGVSRSGYDLFCEVNTNRRSVGLPINDDFVRLPTSMTTTNVSISSKPWEKAVLVNVRSTSAAGAYSILYKVSKPTFGKLTSDSYGVANIGYHQMTSRFEDNLYADIIENWGIVPDEVMYYKLEVYAIHRNSGQRFPLQAGVFTWSPDEILYAPVVVIDNAKTVLTVNRAAGDMQVDMTVNWSNYDSSYQVEYYLGFTVKETQSGRVLYDTGDSGLYDNLVQSQSGSIAKDGLDEQSWWNQGNTISVVPWVRFQLKGSGNWNVFNGSPKTYSFITIS